MARIIATPQAIPRVVARDPDDDHVVACALAAQTDLLVSGDGDLLELKAHRGIRIVSAAFLYEKRCASPLLLPFKV